MFLKMLLSLLIVIITIFPVSVNAFEMYHPVYFGQGKRIPIQVSIVDFASDICEGYFIHNVVHEEKTEKHVERMKRVLKEFTTVVYPLFTKEIIADPLRNKRVDEKILFLFYDSADGSNDNLRKPPAFVSRSYSDYYHRDIIVIDYNFYDMSVVKYILADELQHIFRNHYNENSARWLNEGVSEFSKYYMFDKFPRFGLSRFGEISEVGFDMPGAYLSMEEYFNSFMFVYYLYQHYGGIELVRQLIKGSNSGKDNINSAFGMLMNRDEEEYGGLYNFKQVFICYHLALITNRYSKFLESKMGLLELAPNDDFGGKFLNGFSINAVKVSEDKQMKIKPLSALYFRTDVERFSVIATSKSIVTFVIDLDVESETDDIGNISSLKSGKKYSWKNIKSSARFIVIINTSDRFGNVQIKLESEPPVRSGG